MNHWKIAAFIVIFGSLYYSGAARAQAVTENVQVSKIFTLPEDIAQDLRDLNSPGQRGSCDESNIFVHKFHYFNSPVQRGRFRVMWFLGAPDYLCETKSFVSVIVDHSGDWTVGMARDEDWRRSRNLAGVPALFQHVDDLGFFLTTEWQVEGPANFMYFSVDGETWISLDLPTPARKPSKEICCHAPTISSMCIADSGSAYIRYDESAIFEGRVWRTPIDDAFPDSINWSHAENLPEDAYCDGYWPEDFIPHSLRTKTKDGALFDVFHDSSVLIPGPTK